MFGCNDYSQLGLGQNYNHQRYVHGPIVNPCLNAIRFIECGPDFSLCVDKDGKAFMFGRNEFRQCGVDRTQVEEPFCIQSMGAYEDVIFESGSCGNAHAVLLSCYPEYELYGLGANKQCQTGDYDEWNDYVRKPWITTKEDLGINGDDKIVKVLCRGDTTIVICEI